MDSRGQREEDKRLKSILLASLAGSTVHGISHAAASSPLPLKVMWLLLFSLFVSFFFYHFIELAAKLNDRHLVKKFDLDRVQFVFPDLYFCPSDSYSGSFPYNVDRENAAKVSKAMQDLVYHCHQHLLGCNEFVQHSRHDMIWLVQHSLPVAGVMDLLFHRAAQSVPMVSLNCFNQSHSTELTVKPFYQPHRSVCFQLAMTDEQRDDMRYKFCSIDLILFTDPYFSEFKYSGHPIKGIMGKRNNKTVEIHPWSRGDAHAVLKESGYTMLMTAPGSYPSFDFEHWILLAPGNAYTVRVRMESNTCDTGLRGSQCTDHHPKVDLSNAAAPADLKMQFEYSYATCFDSAIQQAFLEQLGCILPSEIQPWQLRHAERCFNISEMKLTFRNIFAITNLTTIYQQMLINAMAVCRYKYPCTYFRYSTRFSFERWPSLSTVAEGLSEFLGGVETGSAPALAQLKALADRVLKEEAEIGSHDNSSQGARLPHHQRQTLNTYVLESLVRVRVSGDSSKSSQVTMAWSYSLVEFLSDTGGLLGLYIGCSLLTLGELLQLCGIVLGSVCATRKRRQQRQQQTGGGSGVAAAPLASAEAADDLPD